jgi:hypothetical protein
MKISTEIPSRMIDESKYLLYLPEQQLLICRTCKYCLHPDGVENHLQRKHLAIPLKIRKELVSYVRGLTLRSPSEVITPVTVVSAFEWLEVIQGFRCSVCNSLCGTPRSIQEHCRGHTWSKPEGMSCN